MNDNFSETFNLYEKYSDLKLAFLRTKCIGSLGEKNYFMPTVLTFYYISLNRIHTERHILTQAQILVKTTSLYFIWYKIS